MTGSDQTTRQSRYHHGNLRAALLAAAEAELEEAGIEGFSLRKVARRAGVSHAAPAHHFGSAAGLLTALAAEGYRRFVAMQKDRQGRAAPDAVSRLVAAGLGYIDFAERHRALFRLVFSSQRPDYDDPELEAAGREAFLHLARGIEEVTGCDPMTDPVAMQDALAVWATAHGLADLYASGRMGPLRDMPAAEREAALAAIIRRAVPKA